MEIRSISGCDPISSPCASILDGTENTKLMKMFQAYFNLTGSYFRIIF